MRRAMVLMGLAFLLLGSFEAWSQEKADPALIKRGEYLVITGLCHDCHTPKKFTEKGPVADMDRALAGHPQDAKLPPIPKEIGAPNQWMLASNDHLTAWYGPWGISFTRNLTPDMETGIGSWTEEMFVKAMRTGKHMGAPDGRDILPPMPWNFIGQATDQDLHAIWVYLRSLKPIRNTVPEPVPPTETKK